MPRPLISILLGLVGSASFSSGSASAHIHLLEPTPRYPDQVAGENKACPCGVGRSNRICQVEGDRSDPDRSTDRVTTFEAGSSVVLTWEEYYPHSGRYRVAFDPDGADLEDFNAHPLADIPDPVGRVGNSGEGSIWELEVTLPETPCENCTLQLIQVMDGETEEPVPDPVGRSTYYQCADIRIVPDLPDDEGCSLAPGAQASAPRGPTAGFGGLGALGAVSLLALGIRARRRGALGRP
jgi:hypothetical protein